jgi:hypothetical protein
MVNFNMQVSKLLVRGRRVNQTVILVDFSACTLYANVSETPTMKRKNGMTKSAIVNPSHGEWFSAGRKAPASSTMIISCNKENDQTVSFQIQNWNY